MRASRGLGRVAVSLMGACGLLAQVIEFESGGLKYQTLTKGGVTIMFAYLPAQVRDYAIVQVAISNGSPVAWTFNPENFHFRREDGTAIQAAPARNVVDELIDRASRSDVIKIVATYEIGLYGISRFRSTNGYEQRRQSALAEVSSAKLKAAAAASAIAFVKTTLRPGESTDGAVFYPTMGKPLGPGRVIVNAAASIFEFEPVGAAGP